MSGLIFQESPVIELASNIFIEVPIVLKYEDTPLIEVVHEVQAGYEIQIPIYSSDGTYLAKVKGSQLFSTHAGRKAGVTLRHPNKMTVCEINGKPVFEIRREEAAALKTAAELYTNDGSFIKCDNKDLTGYILQKQKQLKIAGAIIHGNTFQRCKIGIHVRRNGSVHCGG